MQYVYPKRIVATDGDVVGAEKLLEEKYLQIGLIEKDAVVVRGACYVILDFGAELSGGARILTHTLNGSGKVRLRFGESVSETCAELGEKNATNDHSLRDFCVELKNYSDMTFGQTGFRFLRLDFYDGAFAIKAVVAANDADDRPEDGAFSCSDEQLNRIWQTAARTLRLCLKNGCFVDGVKRDRLVWIGDVYPELKASYALFCDLPEVKNSLRFSRDQTPVGEWMNWIPLYSVWWLFDLCAYYARSQDADFVRECLPFVRRVLSDISACVNEQGETSFPYNFVDWPTHYEQAEGDETKRNDELAGTNYFLRLALTETATLLEKFGENADLAKSIVARLERKKYVVARYKQIAALAVLVGEDVAANVNRICEGGAKGLTTFLNYFIFTALAKVGKHATALEMVRAYYGKMLDLGATTFWEDFDLDWAENAYGVDECPVEGKRDIHGDFGRFCYEGFRHSLCHGWASGVLAYLSENVLGVQAVEGDARAYRVRPNLCDLDFVEGKYPTPYGVISLRASRLADGSVKTEILSTGGVRIITD